MGRLYIAVGAAAILLVVLIGSATNGMISRIPELSRKGLFALVGVLCLAALAGWFYLNGGFDYLMWLYDVPSRPAAEMRFVSLVENQMNLWADGEVRGEDACRRATEALDMGGQQATDWGGTVHTVYRVGTREVVVVRIGRYTMLRTSYNASPNAVLLEPGSDVFDQAITLESGDPVRFSGSIVTGASDCAFQRNAVGQDVGAAVVFRFTQLQRG